LTGNNPLKAYKETQIRTATPGKLLIMLYDAAIKNINLAYENMVTGYKKNDLISNCIIKTQDIISELMVSLDFERGGEIAKNLFSLYMFMNRQLLDANIKKTPEPLLQVKKMLMELREAWVQIIDKKPAEVNTPKSSGINIAG